MSDISQLKQASMICRNDQPTCISYLTILSVYDIQGYNIMKINLFY